MATNNNPIYYKDLVSPDNSITDLIKQLDELSDSYTNALQNIKREAIQLTQVLQSVSGATEQGQKVTKQAASDADRLARAQRELAFAESENAKKLAEIKLAQQEANQLNKLMVKLNQSAEGSYNKLSAQYSINKIYLNNMTEAERKNTKEGRELEEQTRKIYEEMKRLQESTGKFQLNVGNYTQASDAIASYSDKLKDSLGINREYLDGLLALGKGGEESKAAFTAMEDGAKALGKSLLGLLTNPVFLAIAGIAGAGVAFKWWYDYNAGLVEATRLTQQFTGLSGDSLKAYRNEVQAISNTFDVDFTETLQAANSVAQQFGISASEALSLIKDGFVAGANVNGEYLDTLKEYPAYFQEAGLSASQFIAITTQANKAGIFSDKGVDAIKEGNLRLREMTKATADALDGIGISSKKVQEELQNGSKTTFDVMQEVSEKLNELPDSASVVGTAIADIFGGPGEDAGLQYLRTLKDISTNMDEVKSKAGTLAELQEEQLKAEMELQNALAALFDQTGGNFETLTTKAKLFVTNGLVSVIKGIANVINWAINLYNRSLAIRIIAASIISQWKTLFDFLANGVKAIGDVFKGLGSVINGVFTLSPSDIIKGLEEINTAVPKAIKRTMADAAKNVSSGLKHINDKIKPITIPTQIEGVKGTEPTRQGRVTTNKPISASAGSAKGTADKAKKAEEQRKKEIEDAYKKNLEAKRKYEDAVLALEKDSYEKSVKQTTLKYNRHIEDLRHSLVVEENLTKQGREAINKNIEALEYQKNQELTKLEQDQQIKDLEYLKESIALRLSAVKEGSDQERQLKLEQIKAEEDLEILRNAQKPESQQQAKSDIIAKYDAQRSGVADQYMQAQLAIFDQQQDLAQSEFDLLRNSEERKTQFKLQAEKARWQKILELNKQAGNKLSDAEVETIKNTIAKIDQEISQSKGKERSNDVYGLFGLNLDDEQKEAINTSVQYATDALNSYIEAWSAAADKKVENANKEVESAQSVLDAEIEARNNGYANNVVMAQKELDAAKKNQEKALKEQQKAQKAQAAIQTVQQISNLVTSTSLIWSQLGFPWAIPAIAVMWGSFAAAKIKAAQLSKQSSTESYGEGTVELLDGGSHQSGNDVDLGTKPNGTKRRAEGGEFFAVINKRNSRKYRRFIPSVIHSLNNGTFERKYLNAYDGANSLSVNVQGGSTPEIEDLKRDVRTIKEQNARRVYIDGNGNTIEHYKNLKRTIKH